MLETLVTSSVLIAALCVLRLTRGRVSARLIYALWLTAALRLMLPFSLVPSPVSVANLGGALPDRLSAEIARPGADFSEGFDYVPGDNPPAAEVTRPEGAQDTASSGAQITPPDAELSLDLPRVLRAAWICGAGALAAFIALRNAAMYRALKRSRRRLELDFAAMPVYLADGLPTPCLAGVFRPEIYLTPAALETPERTRMAVLHEETHFRHGDHIWALLRCALLCVYWFDPFVWLAAYLSRRDCELACDESCVKRLGPERRAEYGGALIDLIDRGRRAGLLEAATTMSSGKRAIRERIGRIASFTRSHIPALAAVVVLALAVSACTFTGADDGGDEPEGSTAPSPSEDAIELADAGTLADGLECAEAEAPEGWEGGAIYAFYLDGEFIGRLSEGYIEDYGGMDAAADRLYLEYINRTAPEFAPEDVEIDCDISYIPQDVLDYVRACVAGYSQDDRVLWNTLESELTGLELEMNAVVPIPARVVEFYSAEYRLTPDRPELVDEGYTLDDEGRVVQDTVFAFILEDGERIPVRPRNDWPIVINDESDYGEYASLCVHSYETGAKASRAEFAAPEGVDMGEFSRGCGDYGGWVSAETAFGGYGSGSLNVTAPAASVTALDADRFDITEDGLSGGYFLANHRGYDGPQPAAELGEGAYVCREYADLYIGSDFEALWQQGLDVDFETMSFQSDYHTVFLTRPESTVVWKLSLAANMFTREDVLALAESFVWPN